MTNKRLRKQKHLLGKGSECGGTIFGVLVASGNRRVVFEKVRILRVFQHLSVERRNKSCALFSPVMDQSSCVYYILIAFCFTLDKEKTKSAKYETSYLHLRKMLCQPEEMAHTLLKSKVSDNMVTLN